jgi:hypothetical protein
MTLTPKDQKILDQLDSLDVSLTIGNKAIADGMLVSKTIRALVNVDVPVPPIPPDPPIPPVSAYPIPAPGETYAKEPQIYINSTRPTVTGKTILVPIGADFQAALNNAKPGDEVVAAMGSRFVGNYNLPAKAAGGWITVRPDILGGLPPAGTRRLPKAGMPIFESPNNLGVFTTGPASARWHFLGIEGTMPVNIDNTGFIRLGVNENTLNDLPREIVFEQVYIHGDPNGNFRRAFLFNGIHLSLIDSYVDDCHQNGSDSQCVGGWNGPGPFKIWNCFLRAASENVAFGGGDPSIAGLVPSDIDIRRNHMTKDTKWIGKWDIKNIFELKNARRVRVEGNVMENVWASAQAGSIVNMKSVNQGSTAPWCTVQDVMFRFNVLKNMGSGFNLSGYDQGPAVPMERITIIDNILDGMFPEAGSPSSNPAFKYTGDGRGALVNNRPVDVEIIHNTILEPWNAAMIFGGPDTEPPVRLFWRDNICGGGLYGVKGPSVNTADTFKIYMKDGKFVGNVVITKDGTGYPTGNFFPVSRADVGFVSATDLRLAATSKYKGKATDGRDPGADIDAVMKATAGVVIP